MRAARATFFTCLYRRIVFLDEFRMTELDGQCRFAHAAGTEDHDFVLFHADSLADGFASENEQFIQRGRMKTTGRTASCFAVEEMRAAPFNAINLEEKNKTPGEWQHVTSTCSRNENAGRKRKKGHLLFLCTFFSSSSSSFFLSVEDDFYAS